MFGRIDGRPAAAIATRLDPASTGRRVALRAGVVSGSRIMAVRVGLAPWALAAGGFGPGTRRARVRAARAAFRRI